MERGDGRDWLHLRVHLGGIHGSLQRASGVPAQGTICRDHFCEQHGQKEALNLADGLTENMQLIGLSEGETLKEITEPTACYRCGNSAKYAQITMTTTHLCKRHRGFRAVVAGVE
jgi:hypothetical protein